MSYFFEMVEISENNLYFWKEIDYGEFEFEFRKLESAKNGKSNQKSNHK